VYKKENVQKCSFRMARKQSTIKLAVHLGGKIMHHSKALRTISLIFAFTLVTFSCATSKNQIAIDDFGLTAEAVPEGILLTFSNIPSDATQLWIHVISWGDTDEPEQNKILTGHHSVISSYAAIEDSSFNTWVNSTHQLEKIKQNSQIIFPIVQAGAKYRISATVYNARERSLFVERTENIQPRSASAEITANNGIHFNRDNVRLELNDTNSIVTLSSEPIFSSAIIFDEQKYSFGVTVLVDENSSVGVGDHHIPNGLSSNGLTWAFEPQMTTVNFKNHEWLETGSNYPAWATARVNIIYDDIKWSVEIAKTSEFTYSL
jgi:hypothetical protein